MMIKTLRNAGAAIAALLALTSSAFGAGFGGYPIGAVPIAVSATGTTLATAATLPAAPGQTTYICGFSIRAVATANAAGNATVTGTLGGTLNFTHFIPALSTAAAAAPLEPPLGSFCLPASAINTAIVVTSAAAGSGGVVSVTVWGFQL
jgi:hypothetical protein